MIKAVAESQKGQPLILIGLSEDNVRALKMNMPIDIETAELGLGDSRVIIFYGKTEDEMAQMFKDGGFAFGEVHDHRGEDEGRPPAPPPVAEGSMVVETGGNNVRLRFGNKHVVLNKDAARALHKMLGNKLDRMDGAEPGEAVAVDDMRMPFVPDAVLQDPTAINVLAAWVLRPEEGNGLTVVVNPQWEDPGVWGIALVDIARHVARAYSAKDNVDQEVVLERVRELVNKEFDHQTSPVTGGPVPVN